MIRRLTKHDAFRYAQERANREGRRILVLSGDNPDVFHVRPEADGPWPDEWCYLGHADPEED